MNAYLLNEKVQRADRNTRLVLTKVFIWYRAKRFTLLVSFTRKSKDKKK